MARTLVQARRRGALVALLSAALLLAGCSSSNDGGMPADALVETVLAVLVSDTQPLPADIAGLQLTLTFEPTMVVSQVLPVGPLADGTCDANVGTGFVTAVCVATSTFGTGERAWEITFVHPASAPPQDAVLSLGCLASDDVGGTFGVTCELA